MISIILAFNVCQVCGRHICHMTRAAHAQYISLCAVDQRRCVFQLSDVTSTIESIRLKHLAQLCNTLNRA